jgi:hypothetical protein
MTREQLHLQRVLCLYDSAALIPQSRKFNSETESGKQRFRSDSFLHVAEMFVLAVGNSELGCDMVLVSFL